jgi:hypothetical protein
MGKVNEQVAGNIAGNIAGNTVAGCS